MCCTRLRANLTQMSRVIRDRVSRSSGEFPTHLSTETRPWARPRAHTPHASTDRKGSRHITPNHRGEAICRDMILGTSRAPGARFLLDLFCPKFNSRGFASWRPGACPGVRPGSIQHKHQRSFTPSQHSIAAVHYFRLLCVMYPTERRLQPDVERIKTEQAARPCVVPYS